MDIIIGLTKYQGIIGKKEIIKIERASVCLPHCTIDHFAECFYCETKGNGDK